MDLPTPSDIRQRRTDLGLTQQEVAEAAGVSQPLIARVEGGDVDPRLSTLRRIIEALDEAEAAVVRASDLMSVPVVSVAADDPIRVAADRMNEAAYSQLPVTEDDVAVGSITLGDLAVLDDVERSDPVREHMQPPFPSVTPEASQRELQTILEHARAVVVTEEGHPIGIITEANLAARLS
ncbi:MAG: CBS domain-containing protein [Halobacteriales archaeon]